MSSLPPFTGHFVYRDLPSKFSRAPHTSKSRLDSERSRRTDSEVAIPPGHYPGRAGLSHRDSPNISVARRAWAGDAFNHRSDADCTRPGSRQDTAARAQFVDLIGKLMTHLTKPGHTSRMCRFRHILDWRASLLAHESVGRSQTMPCVTETTIPWIVVSAVHVKGGSAVYEQVSPQDASTYASRGEIPPRSVYYSLEAKARNTSTVESLTGYLRRLAGAHGISVTDLICHEHFDDLFPASADRRRRRHLFQAQV